MRPQAWGPNLAQPFRRVFLFDVVAEVTPRRRRARKAAPHLRWHSQVFVRTRRQLDDELARALVVARGAQASSGEMLHVHDASGGKSSSSAGAVLTFERSRSIGFSGLFSTRARPATMGSSRYPIEFPC